MACTPQYGVSDSDILGIITSTSNNYYRSDNNHCRLSFTRNHNVTVPSKYEEASPPRYPSFDELSALVESMSEERDYARRSLACGYGGKKSSHDANCSCCQQISNASTFKKETKRYTTYTSTHTSCEPCTTDVDRLQSQSQFKLPADIHGENLKTKLDKAWTAKQSSPRLPSGILLGEVSYRNHSTKKRFVELNLPAESQVRLHDAPYAPTRSTSDAVHFRTSLPTSEALDCGYTSPSIGLGAHRPPCTWLERKDNGDTTSLDLSFKLHKAHIMRIEDEQPMKRLHVDDDHVFDEQKLRKINYNNIQLLRMRRKMSVRNKLSPHNSEKIGMTSLPQTSMISSISNSLSDQHKSPAQVTIKSKSSISIDSSDRYALIRPAPSGTAHSSHSSTCANSVTFNTNYGSSDIGPGFIAYRAYMDVKARRITKAQKSGETHTQILFVCECCPKQPKRCETLEELRTHKANKQYDCLFCGARFKNKNEAERHQNTLHLRRRAWSCWALSGFDKAFHDSVHKPGRADSCGYCGDDFARSGYNSGERGTNPSSVTNSTRYPTDQDWDDRFRHLQKVHKFQECNPSKNFYRADNFRQHLKHSHAGAGGKLTSSLENACMWTFSRTQADSQS